MSPGPRSRRRLLLGGGAALVTGLGGCMGRLSAGSRASAGGGSTAPSSRTVVGNTPHGIDLVCYNREDRPRELTARVVPADDADPRSRSVTVDPGGTVRLPDVIAEPTAGSVPHEVTVTTAAGDRDGTTVRANAVHDLHEVHALVDDGVDVHAVDH